MLNINEASSFIIVFSLFLCNVSSVNITNQVFGGSKDYSPAAFGDFNSDKLIDMFVLQDDGKTLQVLIATSCNMLMNIVYNPNELITSHLAPAENGPTISKDIVRVLI